MASLGPTHSLRSDISRAVQDGNLMAVLQMYESTPPNEENIDWKRVLLAVLCIACRKGDMEIVTKLVAAGVDVNGRDHARNWTPIGYARKNGFVDIVRFLLEHGATRNYQRDSNQLSHAASNNDKELILLTTPFHEACLRGKVDLVEKIILENSETNVNEIVDEDFRYSPLTLSVVGGHVEVMKVLLDNGADVNHSPTDWNRKTALHVASEQGWTGILGCLLERAAQVNQRDRNGFTALHYARKEGKAHVVEKLLRYGAEVEYASVSHPIDTCSSDSESEMFGSIDPSVSWKDRPRLDVPLVTPFHAACAGGDLTRVTELLDCESVFVDDVIDRDYEWSPIALAFMNDHVKVVKVLVENGADIDHSPREWVGESALHRAIKFGSLKWARLLMDLGADVNKTTVFPKTSPLCYAVKFGQTELRDELLKRGAKDEVPDSSGAVGTSRIEKVLENCRLSRYKEAKELIESAKGRINLNAMDRRGMNCAGYCVMSDDPSFLMYLQSKGANLEAVVRRKAGFLSSSLPLLHLAAVEGAFGCLGVWSEEHLAVQDTVQDGRSALHVAFTPQWIEDSLTPQTSSRSLTVAEFLIDTKKVPINIRDRNGLTPLDYAARNRFWCAVKWLSQKGGCFGGINEPDDKGYPPVYYCIVDDEDEILQLLMDNGADLNIAVKEFPESPAAVPLLHHATIRASLKCLKRWPGELVNVRDEHQRSALHAAFASRNRITFECLKVLIDKGIVKSVADENGWSVLDYALRYRYWEEVAWLENIGVAFGSDPSPDAKGDVPPTGCLEDDNLEMLERYLAGSSEQRMYVRDGHLRTLLHMAIKFKSSKCISFLLSKGSSVDALDDRGWSCLAYAVRSQAQELVSSFLFGGAAFGDVNTCDEAGNTVSFYCLESDDAETLRSLVENGADLSISPLCFQAAKLGASRCLVLWSDDVVRDTKDQDGRTLLHAALDAGSKGCEQCVKVLLAKGAPLNAADANGRTALDWAIRGRFWPAVYFLIGEGAALGSGAVSEAPLASFAVLDDEAEVLQFLIDHGAKVSVDIRKYGYYFPLLFLAVETERLECLKVWPRESINVRDYRGRTALHVAADSVACREGRGESEEIVRILLEKGVDREALNEKNLTALEVAKAQKKRNLQICKLLE